MEEGQNYPFSRVQNLSNPPVPSQSQVEIISPSKNSPSTTPPLTPPNKENYSVIQPQLLMDSFIQGIKSTKPLPTNPPEFRGSSQDPIDWELNYEFFCKGHDLSDSQYITVLTFAMKDSASLWCQSNFDKFKSWDQFLTLFRQQYVTDH